MQLLAAITTGVTQKALFELGQQARELQHVLLDGNTHGVRCLGYVAYSLRAVADLNKVRLLLSPLTNDFGVPSNDRHAAGVHTAAMLRAIEDGDIYDHHLRRLQALHRHHYQPIARH